MRASISRPSRWRMPARRTRGSATAGFPLRPLVEMQRPGRYRGGARDRGVHGRACRARRHGGGPHPDPHASHRRTRSGRSAGSCIPTARARWRASSLWSPDVEEAAARFARFTGRPATRDALRAGDCARSRSRRALSAPRLRGRAAGDCGSGPAVHAAPMASWSHRSMRSRGCLRAPACAHAAPAIASWRLFPRNWATAHGCLLSAVTFRFLRSRL